MVTLLAALKARIGAPLATFHQGVGDRNEGAVGNADRGPDPVNRARSTVTGFASGSSRSGPTKRR